MELKEFEESEHIEHGQVVNFPHKHFINYFEDNDIDCDGEVYWESVLEGLVCNKCNLYTGVK